MIINPNWTFKELSRNLKRLKKEYIFYLAFFSYHEDLVEVLKQANAYKKNVRTKFYQINIKEWQIDMAWEFMNDYLPYSSIRDTVRRIDRGQKKC